MKKYLATTVVALGFAVLGLFVSACSTTDSGTHPMGGRAGTQMSDDMMPSRAN